MKTFDLEEAAAYLRVSKDSMRDIADSGKVAGAKIGATTGYRWIFTEDCLDDFLRSEIERQTKERRQRSGYMPWQPSSDGARRLPRRPPKLKSPQHFGQV